MHEPGDSAVLVERVREGDRGALGELLEQYRERLARLVRVRMDRRVVGRIDPADVLQETFMEAVTRIDDYLRDPKTSLFLWLRFLTIQQLIRHHRRHLGVQARGAGREVSLHHGALPGATSADLAAQLLGKHTTPSQAAIRAELQLRLEDALSAMEPIDREVLALRHFEQLTNAEVAEVLGIKGSAASNRYVRAVKRLKDILDQSRPSPRDDGGEEPPHKGPVS
jgi:RNA polymerase sigma-70 factor (ECF subfamily)